MPQTRFRKKIGAPVPVPQSYQHFEQVAAEYDRVFPDHIREHYLKKRVRMFGPMVKGGIGLDVGCGTGVLMEALRGFGTVVGADGSAGMLKVLRLAGRGAAVRAPTNRLPFADGTFDLVYTVAVLHHVADAARVRETISEMARVVRASGRVVIWDHNPANPYWPIVMRRAPQDTGEERLIPAQEILSALREAGMTKIRLTRSGLVPEFAPKWLMPLARTLEWLVERTPGLRRLAAHNVIVAER